MERQPVSRTVVITGASSGIGLATALACARRGDRVALAARSVAPLERAASACRALGARAIAVPTDVAEAEEVEALAMAAEQELGPIDAWVNNAAVAMFGRFEQLPPQDIERVVAVNVLGYAWGAQAAVRRFKERGRGVLVNVGSANGRIGSPLSATYVMTKFATDGLSESLRIELAAERDIHVCTVLPASVDTPLYANAANYVGVAMGPAPPVFTAQQVAAAILRCIDEHPAVVHVGWSGRLGRAVHALSPRGYETIASHGFPAAYSRHRPAAPTAGNLHRPTGSTASIDDGWRDGQRADLLDAVRGTARSMVARTVRRLRSG